MKAKIKNATQHLYIHVTERDIKGAICRDHQRCVIAKTLKRVTSADWVDVGARTVLVKKNDIVKRYWLPPIAREQVRFFDTHRGRYAPCLVMLSPPTRPNFVDQRKGSKARSGKHVKRASPTR